MAAKPTQATPGTFPTFGHGLKYLRRRARLTQRELGLAVGYSEAQICRLEQNQRLPDPITLAALFVPALGLERDQALAARLLELAAEARGKRRADAGRGSAELDAIPASPRHAVPRRKLLTELRERLASIGVEVDPQGPEAFGAQLRDSWALFRPVIQQLGIRAE